MSVPSHIVAVAALVTDAQGRILMLRAPRRGWEFPGGQVEEGETLTEALRREVLEETGIEVAVGALAGVYSNTKSRIVMFGFLCEPSAGSLRTSAESLEVEWVARSEVLGRIARPPIRDRMRDMLEFNGRVVYRAYAFNTGADDTDETIEYTIHEEKWI